jgi:DNA polymerase-4
LPDLVCRRWKNLRKLDLPALKHSFGRCGLRLHELARGVDNSEVAPGRPALPISVEDSFAHDALLGKPRQRSAASSNEARMARTVVLGPKTSEFKILTRSRTACSPPSSCEESTVTALNLREGVALGPLQGYRLVGVGLSNFREPENTSAQPGLFQLGD